MFVTSTSMHIMPIITVDGQPIGNGHIGPATQALMADFEEYYVREMGREAIIG
jgi:D-alanine transaminase